MAGITGKTGLSSGLLEDLRYKAFQRAGGPNSAFDQVVWKDELPSELPTTPHTFLFSGPPLHTLADADTLTPIGMVQDVTYNAQRQIAQIAELGNRYYRIVGGRWNHAVSIQRIMSKQANLVGALYRWHLRKIKNGDGSLLFDPTADQPELEDEGTDQKQLLSFQAMSLDSDLLNIPLGLFLVHLTEQGEQIAAEYWEHAMIVQFGKAIPVGQVTVTESCQLLFSRAVPMKQIVSPYSATDFTLSSGSPKRG